MLAYLLIFALALLAVLLRKLTLAGGVAGAVVALCLYYGLGYAGLALLGTFFVLGTLATSYKKEWKISHSLREHNGGRRNSVQVWCNGGVAALCAAGAALAEYGQNPDIMPGYGRSRGFCLMAAAALSAATADTLASELGNVWGRRYINIRTLRSDTRGVDGAISLEGTLAGLAGSCLIALLYFYGMPSSLPFAAIVVAAGTFGNLADSWLGATLQRRGRLDNDGVNFMNTLLAALLGGVLTLFF